MNWLYGKKVVISGASAGIGKEVSRILIEKYNCTVFGLGRNEQKLIEFKKSLGLNADHFTYKTMNVEYEDNWKNLSLELKPFDILINNAGQLPEFNKFENYKVEDVENLMKVNFLSCVYSIHYLRAKARLGIVNVSSSASLMTIVGTSIYSASKSALKSFTESLILEKPKKYYIGLVCPGFAKSDIMRNQVNSKNKLIDKLSMPTVKMAKKVVRGISRKRKKMVLGADAKAMSFFGKLCPFFASGIAKSILKKSRVELFEKVFK